MITGTVNAQLELIVSIPVLAGNNKLITIDSAIDTAFDEDLTLPIALARSLGLTPLQPRHVAFASGSVSRLEVYEAAIEWDGKMRRVTVLAVGDAPLIGTQLLAGFKLTAEMKPGGAVTLEALP